MGLNQTSAAIAFTGCAIAFFLAWRLTGLARALALKWDILARVSERSSHTQPTPRLGGAGLVLGFAIAAALTLIALHFAGVARAPFSPTSIPLNVWVMLAAGWAVMFAIGLSDDINDLRPLIKLGWMGIAAAWGSFGLMLLLRGTQGANHSFTSQVVWEIVLLGWILFFTNAYNFMDGMDGFAGSFALVAALGFFAVVWIHAENPLAAGSGMGMLPPLLAAACSGFLLWNRPPAKVFMGDGGSLSVGYLLALWGVLGATAPRVWPVRPLTALTILLPFIFDVVLTLARRTRRGENLLRAHREHLYQRLLRTGLDHGRVLRMNLRLFLACAALGVAGSISESRTPRALCLALALLVILNYWRQTLRREQQAKSL